MKKVFLIIFLSLLGFTSHAFTYLDGCLKHKNISGVNSHVAVVTLDASAGGASMDLYYLGWYYGTSASPTLVNGNWVYEFIIGGYTSDPHCLTDFEIIPSADPYDASAPDLSFCHCEYDIKDACITRGTYGNQIAKVLYGPDVQGITQPLWYWDPNIPGFQGPFWPTTTPYWNGTYWLYEYDLGVITGLIAPMRLYTTHDATYPPTDVNDPNIIVRGCGANMLFACADEVNGDVYFTVAYDQGILGFDENLFWYDGTSMILCTLLNKTMVNGIWRYLYKLSPAPSPSPGCYELYHSSAVTIIPTAGVDQHLRACKCVCDVSFEYCVNPGNPYTAQIKFNYPNPLQTITITVDGVPVYNGPQVSSWSYDFGFPGSYEVCVKAGDVCQYCIPVCVAEQSR